MRLVFMGTPYFAIPVLARLLDAGHQVVCVVTRQDRPTGRGRHVEPPPVKVYAEQRSLRVLQPPSLRGPEAVEQLASQQPDAIIVAAYGRILPPEVLALPRKGVVNLHPSLLPRHRGPSPVITALLEGDEATGVTVMLLDEGMDTGPILAQRREPILSKDTTGVLTERLFRLGADLLEETLRHWEAGQVTPVPQDEKEATSTGLYTKVDGELDWTMPTAVLERRVRAFDPWPGCSTRWRGKGLRILEGAVVEEVAATHVPGDIIALTGKRDVLVAVVTGADGAVGPSKKEALGLLRLQLEGRRPQSAEEFLRGYPDFVGSRLPS